MGVGSGDQRKAVAPVSFYRWYRYSGWRLKSNIFWYFLLFLVFFPLFSLEDV